METTVLQGMGFEDFINDIFLVNLYRRTTLIHGSSVRANSMASKTNIRLALPAMLGLIDSTAKRMLDDLANESRSVFDSLIHDLKNMLTAIMGNTCMARSSWLNNKYDESRNSLSDLEKASHLSRNLVIDTGNQIISGQLKDGIINKTGIGDKKIQDIVQIALNLSDSRRIGDPQKNMLTPVKINEANAELLIRILLNLFNNAYDAMHEKQYVNESPSLKIFTDVRNEILDIEVKDNGIGMAPDVLEKIFNKGFTTKSDRGGEGTGLHTCKKIIEERIRGKVLVESVLGKGTKFNIQIPLV